MAQLNDLLVIGNSNLLGSVNFNDNVNIGGITLNPSTNIISGAKLEYIYDTAPTQPDAVIKIGSNNFDVNIFKVYDRDSGFNTNGGYGYSLMYNGAGSGINNALTLYCDNTSNNPCIGWQLNQPGNLGLGQAASATYRLAVKGDSMIDGTVYANNIILSSTTNGSQTAVSTPAVRIGASDSTIHLIIDRDAINAKATSTTVGALKINESGGLVTIGPGGLETSGNVTISYESSTWINSANKKSAINLTGTGYTGWISGPSKNGRLVISSYPGSNDNLYFGYMSNANITAGTNAFTKQMYWSGGDGLLVVDKISTKINVNASTPTSGTIYYPIFTSTGTTDYASLKVYSDYYYYYNSAYSSLNIGKTTKKGILSLWLNSINTDIIPSATSSATITLPDRTGTLALIKTWNDFIHSGNEFTFASPGYGSSSNDGAYIWINYRTASGTTDGNINGYKFGNGKKTMEGVTVESFAFKGKKYRLTDKASNDYSALYDNGTNLWIGAEATAAKHHIGGTYISAGHSGTAGNSTIYISVPNAANDNGTNYGVFHAGFLDVSKATAGTLAVARGGTGKTTGRDACNYFLNELTTGDSVPSDADYYISQYVNGGTTTTTTYHRRPVHCLWNYINKKSYGTCSTAAATAAKTVSCANFALATGAKITVKFTVTNTAENPTLNVNSTGAKPIFYRGAAITKSYLAAKRFYTFVYDGTNYELIGDVDTNTNTYVRVYRQTTGYNGDYPILVSRTATADIATVGSNSSYEGVYAVIGQDGTYTPTVNPHTGQIKIKCNTASSSKTTGALIVTGGVGVSGNIYGNNVYGAVWNDYAEFRDQKEKIEPGYCVASTDSGEVYKTSLRLQPCDGIVSDTFGFAIGETDNCKTPLAVAGRVLAYCEGDRYDYHAGDTVCATSGGLVTKMTRDEIKEYPDRIIGIVSEIPEYDIWGSGNVKVNNRIWIKVK